MSRPRIRTLKPEMWADEKIGHLSHSARLLFIGLVTMADDEGRLRALPVAILGHVFPHENVTPKKLEAWLQELERVSLIVGYTVAGKGYIVLPGWAKHQRVNRAGPSELPPPPFTDSSVNGHDSITERSVKAHGVLTEDARPRVRADRIGSSR